MISIIYKNKNRNMKCVNNNKISFSEKIKQIKVDNPGKFNHLPDPIPVGVLSNWKEEDILEFESELKYKFEVESRDQK